MVGDAMVWPGSELELSHFTLLWISILKKKNHKKLQLLNLKMCILFYSLLDFVLASKILNYLKITYCICILKIFSNFLLLNLMASDEIVY